MSMNESEVIVFSTLLALKGPKAVRATIRVPLEDDVEDRVKAFARALGQGPTTPFMATIQERVGLLQCFMSKISPDTAPATTKS
ncbi:hypothetical protein E2P84_43975 [Burkholderia cepacia]|uniref:Uncharacterized protein n=1 Tax=Burkholderia cepacia TaxID=292 RepID=A0AAX2RR00_BURCE|nr:hypothetical protein [Burkholderia cepacia]TES60890.1 hypothetical protein E2P84_43975 [Burkholderia cepacia]TET01664.1 hypothetical protein E3D36_16650 [Burkholderia cepacia]TEU47522.1 hypothetical protein E3D37_16080 [Burkholderia cepacia]TEU53549.1 hypothetical protein E3D38_12470 [Burkholderia cepacia]TEV02155.1 hypothetical protein E3D40_13400 [Burkholderia cepacia]